MQSQTSIMLVGSGLAVAAGVMLGVGGMLSKASMREGISVGWYAVMVGIGITIIGAAFLLREERGVINLHSGFLSTANGIVSGGGTILFAFALLHYGMPLSRVVPLYLIGSLITIPLGTFVFKEPMNWPHFGIGTACVTLGGYLFMK